MTALSRRKVDSSLLLKGFVKVVNDHDFYIYHCDGKATTIRTKLSHGINEVGDSLIGQMSKQTKLSKSQFVDLINCPLSAEEYLNIVKPSIFCKD
jgi:hypothetical protein